MENINTNVNLTKIEQLLEKLFDFGIQLVIAILILFVGFKLIKILEKSLKKHRKLDKLDPSVKGFLVSILSLSLKVLLFVVAASVVGIPTTSFITIIGSCGLAVGLALQGGLSNLAGGVMILMFKPFEVGDYIFVPNIRKALDNNMDNIKAYVISDKITELDLYITDMTDDEKEIVKAGCLINYNRNRKENK